MCGKRAHFIAKMNCSLMNLNGRVVDLKKITCKHIISKIYLSPIFSAFMLKPCSPLKHTLKYLIIHM